MKSSFGRTACVHEWDDNRFHLVSIFRKFLALSESVRFSADWYVFEISGVVIKSINVPEV